MLSTGRYNVVAGFLCMIEYSFSDEEKIAIFDEAYRRQSYNEGRRLGGRNGAPSRGGKALGLHLVGAAGELAVARVLGLEHLLFVDSRPIRGSGDLMNVDVKTRTKHCYDLLIQLDDNPEKVFVLVTIEDGPALIHGWIKGSDCMRSDRIKEYAKGRPCYAVPQDALYPIAQLVDQLGPLAL